MSRNTKHEPLNEAITPDIKKVLESAQTEEQRRRILNFERKNVDSYDELPTTSSDFEMKRKYAHVPVKKKEDRKNLTGYTCTECRDYYKNCNLPKEKIMELVQKCSRHRSTLPPPTNSPKEWLRTGTDFFRSGQKT